MSNKWYNSRMIQAAIIAGIFSILGILLTYILTKKSVESKYISQVNSDKQIISINSDSVESLHIEKKTTNQKFENKTLNKNSKYVEKREKIEQEMINSPGSVQIAGDMQGQININTNRKFTSQARSLFISGLKKYKCNIQVGVLGTGGEPSELAEEILSLSKLSGCNTQGVFHGIGFQAFKGVQIKISELSPPIEAAKIISTAFNNSNIKNIIYKDPSKPENTIYIYVGFKP